MFAQIQNYLRGFSQKGREAAHSRDQRPQQSSSLTSKLHNHTTTTIDSGSLGGGRILSSGRQGINSSKQVQHPQSQHHHQRSTTVAGAQGLKNLKKETANSTLNQISQQYLQRNNASSTVDQQKSQIVSMSLFSQNARSAANLRTITKMQGIASDNSYSHNYKHRSTIGVADLSSQSQQQLKTQLQTHFPPSLNMTAAQFRQLRETQLPVSTDLITYGGAEGQQDSLDFQNQKTSSASKERIQLKPQPQKQQPYREKGAAAGLVQPYALLGSRNFKPHQSSTQNLGQMNEFNRSTAMFQSSEKKRRQQKIVYAQRDLSEGRVDKGSQSYSVLQKSSFQVQDSLMEGEVDQTEERKQMGQQAIRIRVSDELEEEVETHRQQQQYLQTRSPNTLSKQGGIMYHNDSLSQIPYNSNNKRENMIATKSNFTISKQRQPFESEVSVQELTSRFKEEKSNNHSNQKNSASLSKVHGMAKLNQSQSTSSIIPMSFVKQQHPDSVRSSKQSSAVQVQSKNIFSQKWAAQGGFAAAISRAIVDTPANGFHSHSPHQFDYNSNQSTEYNLKLNRLDGVKVEQFSLLQLEQLSRQETQRMPLSALEKPATMPDSGSSKQQTTTTSIAQLQHHYYNLKQGKRGSEDQSSAATNSISAQRSTTQSKGSMPLQNQAAKRSNLIEFKAKSSEKQGASQRAAASKAQQSLSKQQQHTASQNQLNQVGSRIEKVELIQLQQSQREQKRAKASYQGAFNPLQPTAISCYSPKMQRSIKSEKPFQQKKSSISQASANKTSGEHSNLSQVERKRSLDRQRIGQDRDAQRVEIDLTQGRPFNHSNHSGQSNIQDMQMRQVEDLEFQNIKTTEEDIYKQYLNQASSSFDIVNNRDSLTKTVVQQPFEYEMANSSKQETYPEAIEAIRTFKQQYDPMISSRLGRANFQQPTPQQLLQNVKFNSNESATNYNFLTSSQAASQISVYNINQSSRILAQSRHAKSSLHIHNHQPNEVLNSSSEIFPISQAPLPYQLDDSQFEFDSKRTLILHPQLELLNQRHAESQEDQTENSHSHQQAKPQQPIQISSKESLASAKLTNQKQSISSQQKSVNRSSAKQKAAAVTQRSQQQQSLSNFQKKQQPQQQQLNKSTASQVGALRSQKKGSILITRTNNVSSPTQEDKSKPQSSKKSLDKRQDLSEMESAFSLKLRLQAAKVEAIPTEQMSLHSLAQEKNSASKFDSKAQLSRMHHQQTLKSHHKSSGRRKQLSQQYSSVKQNPIDNSIQLEIGQTLERDMTYESERSSIFNENVGNFESHNRNNLLGQYNNANGLGEETSRKQPHDIQDLIQQLALSESQLSMGGGTVGLSSSRLQQMKEQFLMEVQFKDLEENNRAGQTSQGFALEQNVENPSKLLQKHLELNLRMQSLNTLEDSMVSQHQFLRSLDLRNNNLYALPSTFCSLSLLWKLRLDFNLLESLPEELGRLERLEILTVSNNRLKRLPQSLFRSGSRLGMLQVNDNLIGRLQAEVGRLRKIRVLLLHNNLLKRLPSDLHLLRELQEFSTEWAAYMNPPQNKILKDEKGAAFIRDFQKFCRMMSELCQRRSVQVRFVHFVAYFNRLKSVEQLAAMQAYPKNRTIMHYLCLYGNLHLLKDLVRGVGNSPLLNFNQCDSDGITPLILAFKNKQVGTINHLLKYPAVNLNKGCSKYGYPLHCAIKHHDFKTVLKMLKPQYVVNINIRDEEQNNALHYLMGQFSYDSQAAARVGAILLRKGIEVNALNKSELTPLHIAIKCFQNKSLKFALEYNHYLRKKQASNLFDEKGLDKYQHPSSSQKPQGLPYFSPRNNASTPYVGFDFSQPGKNGWTPLHFAVFNNNLIEVELLLHAQHQKELVDVFARDRDGKLPQELCPFNSSIYKMIVKRQHLVIKTISEGKWSWNPTSYGFILPTQNNERDISTKNLRDKSQDRKTAMVSQLSLVQEKLRKINSQASLDGFQAKRRGSAGVHQSEWFGQPLQHNSINRFFRKINQKTNKGVSQAQKSPRAQAIGGTQSLISLNEKIYEQFVNSHLTQTDKQQDFPYRPNMHSNFYNKMKRASSNGMLLMSFGGQENKLAKNDLDDRSSNYGPDVKSLDRNLNRNESYQGANSKQQVYFARAQMKVDLRNLNFGAQEGSDDESSLPRQRAQQNPNFSLQEGIAQNFVESAAAHNQGHATVASVKNQVLNSATKTIEGRRNIGINQNGLKMQSSKTEKNLFGTHLSFMRYPDFGQAINLGNLKNNSESNYNSNGKEQVTDKSAQNQRALITGQPRIFGNQPVPPKTNLPFEEDQQDFQQEIEDQFSSQDADLMKTQPISKDKIAAHPLHSSKQRHELNYPERATLIQQPTEDKSSPLRYMSHPVNFDTDYLVDVVENNLIYDSSESQESHESENSSEEQSDQEEALSLDQESIKIENEVLRKGITNFENPYIDSQPDTKHRMLDQFNKQLPLTKSKPSLTTRAPQNQSKVASLSHLHLQQSRILKNSKAAADQNSTALNNEGASAHGICLGNVSGNASGLYLNEISHSSQGNTKLLQSEGDWNDYAQGLTDKSILEKSEAQFKEVNKDARVKKQPAAEEGDEFCDADDEDAEAGALGLIANKINKFENHNQETQSHEPLITESQALKLFLQDLKTQNEKLKKTVALGNPQGMKQNASQRVSYSRQIVSQDQLDRVLSNTQGLTDEVFLLIGETFSQSKQKTRSPSKPKELDINSYVVEEVKVHLIDPRDEAEGNVYDTNDAREGDRFMQLEVGEVELDIGQTSMLLIDDAKTQLDHEYKKIQQRNVKTKTNLFLMSESNMSQTPRSQQLSATYRRKSIVHQHRQFELTGEFLDQTIGSGDAEGLSQAGFLVENNKNSGKALDQQKRDKKLTFESCLLILNDPDKSLSLKYQCFYRYVFQSGSCYTSDQKKLKYLFDRVEDSHFNQIIRADLSYLMSVTKSKDFIPQLDSVLKSYKLPNPDQLMAQVKSPRTKPQDKTETPDDSSLKAIRQAQSNCKQLMIYESTNAFDILMQDAFSQSKQMMEECNEHIHLERQRSRERLQKSKHTQHAQVSSHSKLQTSNSLYFQNASKQNRAADFGLARKFAPGEREGANIMSAAQLGASAYKSKDAMKKSSALNSEQVGKLVKLKIENLKDQYSQSIISEKEGPEFLIQRVHKSPSNQSIKNLKNAFSTKRIDLTEEIKAQHASSSNHSSLHSQQKVHILEQKQKTIMAQQKQQTQGEEGNRQFPNKKASFNPLSVSGLDSMNQKK